AITTPQGKVLCPDWTTPDQDKQLCCEKNARQAGSAGQKKGKQQRRQRYVAAVEHLQRVLLREQRRRFRCRLWQRVAEVRGSAQDIPGFCDCVPKVPLSGSLGELPEDIGFDFAKWFEVDAPVVD
ncbi:hypothetical protein AAVH_28409, partial [Aphelenchoides avenae]